jgi:uncharacterized RDD family membrane protein YckC
VGEISDQTINPYRAPVAVVEDVAGNALPVEYASKWRRFFNYVIDAAALYAFTIGVLVIVTILDGEYWVDWYEGLGFWRRYLLDIVPMAAYYVVLEGLFGISIGKLVTGTRVVDERGRAPSLQMAVVRTLCRFIPFEPLSLAFSDDDQTRGWHDTLSRSCVVRKSR